MDKETAKAEAKASKERAKEEAKLNKQKQQFLDATAAPSKRIQAFFAYCDLETDTSIIPTLHEYRSRIMLIVSEIIAFSDTQARKGLHPHVPTATAGTVPSQHFTHTNPPHTNNRKTLQGG